MVFAALAHRRNAKRDRVDPEVEIFAQLAFTKRGLEVDVGRANQPEIDVDQSIAAMGRYSRLQHAQELGLEVRRHLANLVEQQRADLRQFEESTLSVLAPVKAPFL